jgi:hypothetical protein
MAATKFMGVSTFLSGTQLKAGCEAGSTSTKLLAIRPEHIRIQNESCEYSMQGVFSNRVFRGNMWNIKLL